MTEESKSDTSISNISDISLGSDSSCNSDINSSGSDTISRIKMSEDIKDIEKMAHEIFDSSKEPMIPFKFDYEDFDNCKLNGEIRKMISYMKITLPIVYVKKTNQYFVGIKKVKLILKGAFIHVSEDDCEQTTRFNLYVSQNHNLFTKHLCFYMIRSGWSIEKIVQALIDGNKIDNVTSNDLKIFKSYAGGSAKAQKEMIKTNNATLS